MFGRTSVRRIPSGLLARALWALGGRSVLSRHSTAQRVTLPYSHAWRNRAYKPAHRHSFPTGLQLGRACAHHARVLKLGWSRGPNRHEFG
jgi:hypothetical protein